MQAAKLGIIGGTGLYEIEGLSSIETLDLTTPFGKPSDTITTGDLGQLRVAFLPRHGKGHHFSPGEIPALQIICALKNVGLANTGFQRRRIPEGGDSPGRYRNTRSVYR